jgi:hypothetical protein
VEAVAAAAALHTPGLLKLELELLKDLNERNPAALQPTVWSASLRSLAALQRLQVLDLSDVAVCAPADLSLLGSLPALRVAKLRVMLPQRGHPAGEPARISFLPRAECPALRELCIKLLGRRGPFLGVRMFELACDWSRLPGLERVIVEQQLGAHKLRCPSAHPLRLGPRLAELQLTSGGSFEGEVAQAQPSAALRRLAADQLCPAVLTIIRNSPHLDALVLRHHVQRWTEQEMEALVEARGRRLRTLHVCVTPEQAVVDRLEAAGWQVCVAR